MAHYWLYHSELRVPTTPGIVHTIREREIPCHTQLTVRMDVEGGIRGEVTAQGHTAGQWMSWEQNSGTLTPAPALHPLDHTAASQMGN